MCSWLAGRDSHDGGAGCLLARSEERDQVSALLAYRLLLGDAQLRVGSHGHAMSVLVGNELPGGAEFAVDEYAFRPGRLRRGQRHGSPVGDEPGAVGVG